MSALAPSAWLAVGVGAALGAWSRWLLGMGLNAVVPDLPLGTLVANVAGGYLIGVAVASLGEVHGLSPEVRLFVITGFLGGLTTFSTFSAESVHLLLGGRYGTALLHSALHLGGSILATIAGIATVRVCQA